MNTSEGLKSSARKIKLTPVDELFSTEESRQEAALEKVQIIPISELYPFPDHPFSVRDDDSMKEMVESIKESGMLSPIVARPRKGGGYEIISGHRRKHACELAGLDAIKVIVRDVDTDILIADPEAEYYPLVQRLGGQVIKISPTSKQYVNPMDLNLDYSDDENPLSLKVDFLLSFCDIVVGSKDGLQPVEKTLIDRCVRLVYRDYLEDPRPENMPTLGDLYNTLRAQEEKEAQFIATALEIYVTGSLNVFNHRTNVDIDNRVVCYDIKELGKQLKQLGMLVIQDQVWNRVTVNRAAGKTTRYYVDEFHLLLKGELASWSVEIWKRFRKWGGIPTGITQNSKDLLASPEIANILENSDFIYMLNQAAGDRQILAKQLNISPHQLSYVTHSGEGEGLLFYGNVILPFIDRFPKDTELYRIMTTKPQEVAG